MPVGAIIPTYSLRQRQSITLQWLFMIALTLARRRWSLCVYVCVVMWLSARNCEQLTW